MTLLHLTVKYIVPFLLVLMSMQCFRLDPSKYWPCTRSCTVYYVDPLSCDVTLFAPLSVNIGIRIFLQYAYCTYTCFPYPVKQLLNVCSNPPAKKGNVTKQYALVYVIKHHYMFHRIFQSILAFQCTFAWIRVFI